MSSSAERPLPARCFSQIQKRKRKNTPTAMATGAGESGALVDQVHPKRVKSALGVHQPRLLASMRPKTSNPRPMALVSSPSTSTPGPPGRPLVSLTLRRAPTTTATPIGTLTQKIHRQSKEVVSHPPRSGPMAAMPAMTAPQMPNATARSLPRKVALTVERVAGRTMAPPTPWRAREAMRLLAPVAIAAVMLPTTKRVTPTRSMVRRPYRSPSRPKLRRRAAKIIE